MQMLSNSHGALQKHNFLVSLQNDFFFLFSRGRERQRDAAEKTSVYNLTQTCLVDVPQHLIYKVFKMCHAPLINKLHFVNIKPHHTTPWMYGFLFIYLFYNIMVCRMLFLT